MHCTLDDSYNALHTVVNRIYKCSYQNRILMSKTETTAINTSAAMAISERFNEYER
jgi:hypothetical protein